jgi:hypothetical protein
VAVWTVNSRLGLAAVDLVLLLCSSTSSTYGCYHRYIRQKIDICIGGNYNLPYINNATNTQQIELALVLVPSLQLIK